MRRRATAAVVVWALSVVSTTHTPRAQQSAAPAAGPALEATLGTYCVTCHNNRLKSGGLSLDGVSLADAPAHADVWEKVIRKVRGGMMPPAGAPRPPADARTALVSFLETSLDRAARLSPNPGRPLAHRLNRTEYANAVRDLLDLRIDASTMLPADDSSGGFDNNADVLGVSPVLLESYLSAAERIAALALGDPKTPPIGELFRVRQDESQDRHIEGLPLGTIGGLQIQTTLPLDGEYQFQVRLFRTNLGTTRGLEYPHQPGVADGQPGSGSVTTRDIDRPARRRTSVYDDLSGLRGTESGRRTAERVRALRWFAPLQPLRTPAPRPSRGVRRRATRVPFS